MCQPLGVVGFCDNSLLLNHYYEKERSPISASICLVRSKDFSVILTFVWIRLLIMKHSAQQLSLYNWIEGLYCIVKHISGLSGNTYAFTILGFTTEHTKY